MRKITTRGFHPYYSTVKRTRKITDDGLRNLIRITDIINRNEECHRRMRNYSGWAFLWVPDKVQFLYQYGEFLTEDDYALAEKYLPREGSIIRIRITDAETKDELIGKT